MGDLLGDGSTWLETQRHAYMTRAVTYSRADASVELAATVGRTEFEYIDAHGLVHRTESRDYLMRAEDLQLSGAATLPQAGDRIAETNDELEYVYEVMSGRDTPPYQWADCNKTTLRVHTKLASL